MCAAAPYAPTLAAVATLLTECCQRKTRCDPGLPRCGPCERNNAHCEYFDPAKNAKIPRNYVVHLQHKVRDLERQLEELEKDDYEPDAEDVVRGAAAVRIHESDENRFLGPSSGIAIVKLVMQLAKQFTDSKSISDIVPDSHARFVKERFRQEDAKPTSKVYPLVSDVAAEELPTRDLTNLLVQLFYLKGESSHEHVRAASDTVCLQSSPCTPSSTSRPSYKTSKPFTIMPPTPTRTSWYAWSLPSACRKWTPSTLV